MPLTCVALNSLFVTHGNLKGNTMGFEVPHLNSLYLTPEVTLTGMILQHHRNSTFKESHYHFQGRLETVSLPVPIVKYHILLPSDFCFHLLPSIISEMGPELPTAPGHWTQVRSICKAVNWAFQSEVWREASGIQEANGIRLKKLTKLQNPLSFWPWLCQQQAIARNRRFFGTAACGSQGKS